jgi:hypothetical protein
LIQFLRKLRHFLNRTLDRLGQRFRPASCLGMIRPKREPIEQSLERALQLGNLLQ